MSSSKNAPAMTSDDSRETEFVVIGQIHQTHGLSGELSVSFSGSSSLHRLIKKGEFCFIEVKNQTYIPYRIRSCSKSGSSAIMSFDMFETVDKAKSITGKKLFFHKEQIPKSYLNEQKELWVEYNIINDADGEVIGTIRSVIHAPGQTLAEVTSSEDNDLLIPLSEDFITDVDHSKKTIRMSVPDGLLDL